MNQLLKAAIEEVESLPESEQDELARALMSLALRKRIDAKLAAAEARGGCTPQSEVEAELRSRYGR